MSVFLLDVNVLLALAWPTNIHHVAAHDWFQENSPEGWATCPLTQFGFVRISMQPAVVKAAILFEDAMDVLTQSTKSERHRFWPLDSNVAGINSQIRMRIVGHHQLADAILLDLAIRNGGKLATFDRRISALLPPADQAMQGSLSVIPS